MRVSPTGPGAQDGADSCSADNDRAIEAASEAARAFDGLGMRARHQRAAAGESRERRFVSKEAERDVSYQKKLTQYEANLHVAEWQFGDGSTRSASIYSLSPCTAIRTPDREHGYQDSASVYRATYDEVSLLRTRTRTRRTTSTS